MGAEPIEHETTACQDSGKTLVNVCNTMFSQTRSVLPEPHLMAASSAMLCRVPQLYSFSQLWSNPVACTFHISAKPIAVACP